MIVWWLTDKWEKQTVIEFAKYHFQVRDPDHNFNLRAWLILVANLQKLNEGKMNWMQEMKYVLKITYVFWILLMLLKWIWLIKIIYYTIYCMSWSYSETFQNSLEIVQSPRKPDFFQKFLCNPDLFLGKTSADRTDIIARMFNIKLKALFDDLSKLSLLEAVKGYCAMCIFLIVTDWMHVQEHWIYTKLIVHSWQFFLLKGTKLVISLTKGITSLRNFIKVNRECVMS